MTLPLNFLTDQFAVHPILLTAVFLTAGLLGGLVGYLMNNAAVKWKAAEFLRSLLFGVLISTAMFIILGLLYAELFVESGDSLLNFVLAGCICFMVSVISLMFCYRFLMRFSDKKGQSVRVKSDD